MILERWIQRTITIQQIPAPTFQEKERAGYMQSEFHKAALQNVHCDSAGNILGCFGGSNPAVVVCAHLDTVFPMEHAIHTRRSGDTIHGQGIGDNSVALGALLELAEDAGRAELPASIWFAATVGEEGLGNLRGMRQLVQFFPPENTLYIVLEGMGMGTIYNRALPIQRLRVTLNTAGGHSWVHSDRASAIHELIHTAGRILNISLPRKPRTTLNIGTIQGGTSINSRANEAKLEIDMRSTEEDELLRLEKQVRAHVKRAAGKHVSVRIEAIGHRPGGSLPDEHPLVQAAVEAFSRQSISPVRLAIGSTDASIPLSLGTPAVCVGLTHGGGAHSDAEFIRISPMPTGYTAVWDLIQSAAALIAQA